MYVVLLGFALAIFALGLFLVVQSERTNWIILAAGCVSVVGVLVAWAMTLNMQSARHVDIARVEELVAPIQERLDQIGVILNLVSEQQLISDRSKAIAYRDTERDVMRRAIHDEITKKDWEAALALANDMESGFGYQQEAERFREEINNKRQEEVRKAVAEGSTNIDRFCRAEQWTQALREGERLARLFPDDARVRAFPQEIEARRQEHKKRLVDSWNDAATRNDVDGSIEILKLLDAYLTPAEAEAMAQTARKIFKDKLHTLGQLFAQRMKEHAWAEAVRVGEEIMAEFPNSRIAAEVRQNIDLLRQRATEPTPV